MEMVGQAIGFSSFDYSPYCPAVVDKRNILCIWHHPFSSPGKFIQQQKLLQIFSKKNVYKENFFLKNIIKLLLIIFIYAWLPKKQKLAKHGPIDKNKYIFIIQDSADRWRWSSSSTELLCLLMSELKRKMHRDEAEDWVEMWPSPKYELCIYLVFPTGQIWTNYLCKNGIALDKKYTNWATRTILRYSWMYHRVSVAELLNKHSM